MLFEDASGVCPHCFENVAIPIDPFGGHKQEFYVDCEVCCRSILVKSTWNSESEAYELKLENDS